MVGDRKKKLKKKKRGVEKMGHDSTWDQHGRVLPGGYVMFYE